MSAPVDVVAVMDALLAPIKVGNKLPKASEVQAARDAIANLLNADLIYDKARRAWEQGRFTDWDDVSENERRQICEDFEIASMNRSGAMWKAGAKI